MCFDEWTPMPRAVRAGTNRHEGTICSEDACVAMKICDGYWPPDQSQMMVQAWPRRNDHSCWWCLMTSQRGRVWYSCRRESHVDGDNQAMKPLILRRSCLHSQVATGQIDCWEGFWSVEADGLANEKVAGKNSDVRQNNFLATFTLVSDAKARDQSRKGPIRSCIPNLTIRNGVGQTE